MKYRLEYQDWSGEWVQSHSMPKHDYTYEEALLYVSAVPDHRRMVEVAPKLKEIWYVAHPVSGDPIANCFKVVQWIKWFTENDPSRIYIAPWVPEVLAFPNTAGPGCPIYESALANDEQIVMKLDGIVAVGGRMSAGMQREWDCAMKHNKWCTDLTQYNTPNDLPEGFFIEEAV